jgi:hypothetical protein
MECAAAVLVLEKASPAYIDTTRRLSLVSDDIGTTSSSRAAAIRRMASMARWLDTGLAFLFHNASHAWDNASKVDDMENVIGKEATKLTSYMGH